MRARTLIAASVGAAALIASPSVADAGARDPKLPDVETALRLQGPVPLEIVDLRVGMSGEWIDPHWIGMRVVHSQYGPTYERWMIESTVASWVGDIVALGAGAAGYLLEEQPRPPEDRLVLVVNQFYCDAKPFNANTCFVDVELQRVLGGQSEPVWRHYEVTPFSTDSFSAPRRVPEQIAERMILSLSEELQGQLGRAPIAELTGGSWIDVAWARVDGTVYGYTVLARADGEVCLDTEPAAWRAGLNTDTVWVPSAAIGDAWVVWDDGRTLHYGREDRAANGAPVAHGSLGVTLLDEVRVLARGYVPIPGEGQERCGPGPAVSDPWEEGAAPERLVGADGLPAGVLAVDKRGRRLDLRLLRRDARRGTLGRIHLVASDEQTRRMSVSEAVELLNHRALSERYEQALGAAYARRKSDGIAAIVSSALLSVGLSAIIGSSLDGQYEVSIPASMVAVSGGIGLSIALPRLGFAERNLRRVTTSTSMEHLGADAELLDAVDAYNGRARTDGP